MMHSNPEVKEKSSQALYLSIALIALFLFFGCVQSAEEKGTLKGHITIGPLCPVETNPPNPNCQPTEKTYEAYEFKVLRIDGSGSELAVILEQTFTGDKNGNYEIMLQKGTYEIMQETGISKYSNTVVLKAGEITTLDIDIDTGIR